MTIFVVMITAFITTFTGSALNLSIPDMGRYFGVSAETVGWLVTAYMLTVAAFSVPFGRIADQTGRKRILVIGILLFSVGSAAAVFGFSIWLLIGLRVLQGAGAAMIFSTNTAVLVRAFSPEERGRVLGYSIAANYAGLSAGPVIGGLLNYNLGWRSIFVLTALIGTGTLIVAARKLSKDEKTEKKTAWDLPGNVLYVTMLVLVMYGLSKFSMHPLPLVLVGGGLILGILFVLRERKIQNPVVEVKLFCRSLAYSFSNLAALLNYGSTFAISYLISIYLQTVMGYSSQNAGFILLVQPLLMAILSPFSGRLSDRISPFILASAGMILCSVGLFLFASVTEETRIWLILMALVITGIGFALFSSPNTNAVMACVKEEDYGVASSVLATMRSIGHTLSMVVVTFLVSRYMGNVVLAEAEPALVIKTMHAAFLIFAVACGAGVFLSLKRDTAKKR